VGNVELHLLQGLGEKDVEPSSTVDEHLIESGACNYWFQDEWETPWLGEACPLIHAGEGDGYLRSPKRCRDRWFYAQYFSSGSLLRPSVG
jgi:hypothetical protein